MCASFFEASGEERVALTAAIDDAHAAIEREHSPDGYNIGVNVGEAAGQTVGHLHVHVIPRYRGDMDDPRGGVRHVIPSKGNYERAIEALSTGRANRATSPFLRHIRPLFEHASDMAIVPRACSRAGSSVPRRRSSKSR